MMMPPIVTLMLLVMGNRLARRFWPRAELSRSELITIYIMMTVSVVISGMGMVQFLLTTLGGVYHGATSSNHFQDFPTHIPRWLLPQPDKVFDGFYKGNSNVPWKAWLIPCAAWGLFIFVLLWCMVCINSLLRKQWADRERLTFPLVYLPLEMADPEGAFFRNRLMWAGFMIPVILESMNSLHFLYPSVPYLQIRAYDLHQYFVGSPWDAVGYFPITFYPLTIGLGFLLSLDVSFSAWFFYLFTKFESVASAAMGFRDPGAGSALARIPYLPEQGVGAFIGIVIVALWISRSHWKLIAGDVGRLFTRLRVKEVDDSGEPMSYRGAAIGLMIGAALLTGFCVVAGMSPFIGFAYILVYLIFATAITRMRAEAGPPWNMGPDVNARDVVVHSLGSQWVGVRNLSVLAYFSWFSIEMRCVAMPGQLESFKMAESARIRQRAILPIMLLAIAFGIVASFWACLLVWYHFGAGTAKVEPWRTNMGVAPFSAAQSSIDNPKGPDVFGMGAILIGVLITALLSMMRMRFIWWPFNPIGYAMANNGTMYWLWAPFLIAWICKVCIIRYGGMGAYRRALPFFLGLALGDYIIASAWAIAGSVLGMQMYRCFPV